MLTKARSEWCPWPTSLQQEPWSSIWSTAGALSPIYPTNLSLSDKPIFDSYFARPLPQMRWLGLPRVEADGSGWLTQGGQPLLESTPFYYHPEHNQVPALFQLWKSHRVRRFARRVFRNRIQRESSPALWATDLFSADYFHWLCETLPRILIAAQMADDFRLFLPGYLRSKAYVRESLQLFPELRLSWIEADQVIQFEQLHWISTMGSGYQFNSTLMKILREQIFRRLNLSTRETDSARIAPRLYASRSKAPRRHIINESAVGEILHHNGFHTTHFESMSWREQIELTSQSATLLGAHGAGLSNALFLPPRSNVIELQKRSSWPTCYFRLCHALDLKYHYLFCAHFPPTSDSDWDTDLEVDGEALLRLIQQLT